MNVPTNLFMWIMACLPIIVLLLLMIKFQWGATEAAPVGLAITIITGIVFYKADIRLLAAESAKGIWSALIILLIVWTAILLYQVADEARAFLVIRNGMRKLLPNELLMVLALGWILESFLQGITGFGVPVAVGAPLLMGIGVVPVFAVIIPLLGQAWGNTFGTWQLPGMPWPCPPDLCPVRLTIWRLPFGRCVHLDVECGDWSGYMLVLRKRKGCEEGASRPPYPVPDSGRGRAASDPGQYNHSLLPSGLSLPGGPDTDRQNEDVQTGVECGGQPDYGP